MHVNQFVYSSYPRPHIPLERLPLEMSFTYVTLPVSNVMRFLRDGLHLGATREFPPLCSIIESIL